MIEFTRMNDMKVTPQVNQIEINPWNQRKADLAWHEKYHVQAEAWAPFAEGRHELFTNPILSEIAVKHQKSVGQVVLRWQSQLSQNVCVKTWTSLILHWMLLIWTRLQN